MMLLYSYYKVNGFSCRLQYLHVNIGEFFNKINLICDFVHCFLTFLAYCLLFTIFFSTFANNTLIYNNRINL